MAARIAQKGGSVETSRMIWSELYESTSDANIKKTAAQQLQGLKAQDDEEHLNEIAAEYRVRFGHFPASMQDVLAARMIGGIPVDPAGFPYVLGPDGKSRLNAASTIEIKELKATPQ
jgi:hypothetical protein